MTDEPPPSGAESAPPIVEVAALTESSSGQGSHGQSTRDTFAHANTRRAMYDVEELEEDLNEQLQYL